MIQDGKLWGRGAGEKSSGKTLSWQGEALHGKLLGWWRYHKHAPFAAFSSTLLNAYNKIENMTYILKTQRQAEINSIMLYKEISMLGLKFKIILFYSSHHLIKPCFKKQTGDPMYIWSKHTVKAERRCWIRASEAWIMNFKILLIYFWIPTVIFLVL